VKWIFISLPTAHTGLHYRSVRMISINEA